MQNLLEGPLSSWSKELVNKEINNKSLFDSLRLKEIFQYDNFEIRRDQKRWTILMFLYGKKVFEKT